MYVFSLSFSKFLKINFVNFLALLVLLFFSPSSSFYSHVGSLDWWFLSYCVSVFLLNFGKFPQLHLLALILSIDYLFMGSCFWFVRALFCFLFSVYCFFNSTSIFVCGSLSYSDINNRFLKKVSFSYVDSFSLSWFFCFFSLSSMLEAFFLMAGYPLVSIHWLQVGTEELTWACWWVLYWGNPLCHCLTLVLSSLTGQSHRRKEWERGF